MNIEILFEDDNYVGVNKPAGLIVHADGKTEEPSLVDWILEKYPEMKEVGEAWLNPEGQTIYRPGIVHRLDRETSGVLVIAKNQKSFEDLKKQFQERETEKIYNAFVYGVMDEEDGVIDRAIGKSNKDFRMWSAQRGARGELRDAITVYKVLKTSKQEGGLSYLEVSPKTGRTHQIRVHLKAINHPVIGDSLYAPKRDFALGFKRLALHARSLTFKTLEKKEITIEAPLPEDFERGLKELGK
ncbi:MAG: RluA family pseudouridine synthase [Candidatus Doudnabacteria bacterium]|nr:RluA family pseudouridine synthase [Candidatus Doudnabacteria bacterium]